MIISRVQSLCVLSQAFGQQGAELSNSRLKQPARPVTPLAMASASLGTGPDKARAAPGHAAA